jgi:hypothetical protein
MISEGEAWLLLRKWKEERALVRVIFNSSEVSIDLECRFLKVSDISISLDVGQDTEAIEIGWPVFSFDYNEPQSAAEIAPDERGRFYSAGLIGRSEHGQGIYLLKVKESEKD